MKAKKPVYRLSICVETSRVEFDVPDEDDSTLTGTVATVQTIAWPFELEFETKKLCNKAKQNMKDYLSEMADNWK